MYLKKNPRPSAVTIHFELFIYAPAQNSSLLKILDRDPKITRLITQQFLVAFSSQVKETR